MAKATVYLTYEAEDGAELHQQVWTGDIEQIDPGEVPHGVELRSTVVFVKIGEIVLKGTFGRGWAGTTDPVE